MVRNEPGQDEPVARRVRPHDGPLRGRPHPRPRRGDVAPPARPRGDRRRRRAPRARAARRHDRPQPRVRRGARRPQRVAPARRDPHRARRDVDGRTTSARPTVCGSTAAPSAGAARRCAQATRSSWGRPRSSSSWSDRVLEPVSVGLKLAFLAVLYLFLLWVARSALKDLRRPASAGPARRARSTRPACTRPAAAATPDSRRGAARRRVRARPRAAAWSTTSSEGAMLGRGDVEIHLEDPFASTTPRAARAPGRRSW